MSGSSTGSTAGRIVLAIALLAGLAAAGWFAAGRIRSGDKQAERRRSQATNRKKAADSVVASEPAKNPLDKDFAKYVGSEACAECHEEISELYLASGHARTFHEAADIEFFDRMNGKSFDDPYRGVKFEYETNGRELLASLPGKFERKFPLQYAFGSGDNGVSFLTLIPDSKGRGTHGIEHRVSWVRHKDDLDFTPMHEELPANQATDFFGRLVADGKVDRCVSCHTTTAQIENEEIVRLKPNVGCENCHGPGADHVAAMNDGLDDLKIRFAKGTWKPDDEIDVCAECHRSIDELPDFVVQPDELRIVRFQSVGLVKSECYLQTDHGVSCSNCHNPHDKARNRSTEFYEQKCIDCHKQPDEQALCPVSPKENCIGCHMPKIEVHPGMFFHDHWIRIRTEAEPGVMKRDARPMTPID